MIALLIQLLAIIAWIFISISYYLKRKLHFIIMQLFAYTLYALHYYFLGGFTGALSNMCGIIVLFLILYKELKKEKCYYILGIIILLYLIALYVTYDGIPSTLPVLACVIPLLSNWQNNFYFIKTGAIIGTIFWIIYALVYGSYASIITDTVFISTTLYSVFLQRKREIKYEKNK